MGVCGSKTKAKGKLQNIIIGGGESGKVRWTVHKGKEIPEAKYQTGWEMRFQVDDTSCVSGGYQNENEQGSQNRTYSGSFKDGILEAIALFSDGAQIQYNGKVESAMIKIKCKILQAGSEGNYHQDDVAECEGPIKYE